MLKDDKSKVDLAQFVITQRPADVEPMNDEKFKAVCEFLPNQDDRTFTLD